MKIFNLAAFTALLAIAYFKGSEAQEPSQLIGKAGDDNQSEIKNALVCIMYTVSEDCIGGGALLSSTTVITSMVTFVLYYGTPKWSFSKFLVSIGLNSFSNYRQDCLHYVINIIDNIGPNRGIQDALALVIIEPTSEEDSYPPTSVPHISLATQSYAQGEHTVSEFVIVWNKDTELENHPICNIFVDVNGTISAKIPVPYEGRFLGHLDTYLGGFITRRGTLAGLASSHQNERHRNEPIEFHFLRVDGNNPLIRNLGDEGIKILDIDSAGSSSKKKGKSQEPSDIVELQNNYLHT